VDLVAMKAVYFDGDNGETIRLRKFPRSSRTGPESKREELIDAARCFPTSLPKPFWKTRILPPNCSTPPSARRAPARDHAGVHGFRLKNKGVQPLLDGVTYLLPSLPKWKTSRSTWTATRSR
jgi:elongation factor G